jgi:hypothetical protein
MSNESLPPFPETVSAPLAKVGTAWAAVGITSWSEAAGFLAALYTLILIGEWVYKKIKHSK